MRTIAALVLPLLLSLPVAVGCGSSGGPPPPPDPDIPFVTDEQGRALILHGVNVDYGVKGNGNPLPTIPDGEPERLARDFGMNLVRLLLVWEGVEPQPGVIDQAYLDRIGERVDRFAAAGMYVVLDMHQDVYSRFTCGDGFPEWAVRSDGLPIECPSQWFLGYFEPGVQRAFDNFWAYDKGSHADLQDHYAAMWQAVATRFRDHPAVLGYDIINEPHPGTDFDPMEAIGLPPGANSPSPRFDREELGPFYQRMIDAIRTVDADGFIFFEPRYGAPGNGNPSWLTGLTDPRSGRPRLVYFPHLYSIKLENDQAYDPETDLCLSNWERERTAEVVREGWPLLIGEFGLDPDWPGGVLFLRQTLAMADRLLAGWAYWAWGNGGWSFYDSDWGERPSAGLFARTYPQRVAGLPRSFSFDPETKLFSLDFADLEGVAGPTEIYLPARRHYPDGWTVEVDDPDGSWSTTWDPVREIVSLTVTSDADGHRVTIRPAGTR